MRKGRYLDIYLGDLREQIASDATALNISEAELLRQSYRAWRLGQALLVPVVRAAVLACAGAMTPDERVDDRIDGPAAELARVLGSAYAAQGVIDALRQLREQALADGEAEADRYR